MEEKKKKLNEVDENNVSGGYYFNARGCGHDHEAHEIIGKKGEVLKRFRTWGEAMDWANKENISSRELSWPELDRIRRYSGVSGDEQERKDREKMIASYENFIKRFNDYRSKWDKRNQ